LSEDQGDVLSWACKNACKCKMMSELKQADRF